MQRRTLPIEPVPYHRYVRNFASVTLIDDFYRVASVYSAASVRAAKTVSFEGGYDNLRNPFYLTVTTPRQRCALNR